MVNRRSHRGVAQLVAHLVWDQVVARSSRVTPTFFVPSPRAMSGADGRVGERKDKRFHRKISDNILVEALDGRPHSVPFSSSLRGVMDNTARDVCQHSTGFLLSRHAPTDRKTRRFLSNSTSFLSNLSTVLENAKLQSFGHEADRKSAKNGLDRPTEQAEDDFSILLLRNSEKIRTN